MWLSLRNKKCSYISGGNVLGNIRFEFREVNGRIKFRCTSRIYVVRWTKLTEDRVWKAVFNIRDVKS
jgi:hypothetical protein